MRAQRWGAVALLAASCFILAISPDTAAASAAVKAEAGCVPDPAAVVAAPKGSSAPLPADLVSKLDSAAKDSFKLAAAPGAIVGVQTPQGTWTAAYGYADPAAKTPMSTDMHMRIGSVTKTFTGTIILQLAQDGKLSLDDPIAKYYPGI